MQCLTSNGRNQFHGNVDFLLSCLAMATSNSNITIEGHLLSCSSLHCKQQQLSIIFSIEKDTFFIVQLLSVKKIICSAGSGLEKHKMGRLFVPSVTSFAKNNEGMKSK